MEDENIQEDLARNLLTKLNKRHMNIKNTVNWTQTRPLLPIYMHMHVLF